MRTAAFVAPYLMPATLRFVEAAARLDGVRLGLVTTVPAQDLPDELRARLHGHYRLDDALDPERIAEAVVGLRSQLGSVERLVGTLEQLQVPLGQVRDALGIPGMGAEVARNFRDKARMKTVLRAAGVPCARHQLAGGAEEARRFCAEAGFPVVAKPPAGAGARDTFRLEDGGQLEAWLRVDPPTQGRPVLLEEMVQGQEHSFDSVVVDGRLAWWSVSRYLPSPLEVMENAWIQWAVLLPRELGDDLGDIRDAGHAALRALGLQTGLSHMEWFRTPGGGVAISEVGARPPGAQITSLLSYAHDADVYAIWARLSILDAFDPPERRWAVGAAYLRGQGHGRVRAVHGLDQLQREIGDLVVEARLPERGQSPSASYEGDGYVIVRHPRTDVVVDALWRIVSLARVELAGEAGR